MIISFLLTGIIPALAGNTYYAPSNEALISDHPRSRGEYANEVVDAAKKQGSSPLSRGKLPPDLCTRVTPVPGEQESSLLHLA